MIRLSPERIPKLAKRFSGKMRGKTNNWAPTWFNQIEMRSKRKNVLARERYGLTARGLSVEAARPEE